jgi:alanine racemase
MRSGTALGYGLTETLSRDSVIAILPIGYFDGYDRKLSSIGNVLIGGQRCKVLGRVCMNMIIVDVTDLKKVRIEDEAVLLGKQGKEEITAEEIAQKIGTINYEVISKINPLIPRIIEK